MNELDREIEEALNAEDRALLDKFGEQGLFGQLGSLFSGKLAWLSAVTIFIGTVATLIGFYAVWKFVTAEEVAEILRWGGLAWAAFITQCMIKLWSWMRMESNRVIREIKRLELQIAVAKSK